MYTFWILAAIFAIASADVGLGYHYKVPQTSYGVPSYQFGESSSHHGSSIPSGSHGTSTDFSYKGHSTQNGYQGSTVSQHPTTGFISQISQSGTGHHVGGAHLTGNGVGGIYYPTSVVNIESKGQYYPSTTSAPGVTSVIRPIYSSFIGDASHGGSSGYTQYQNQYLTNAAHKYQQYYVQQQPAQVYKHYFVHSAPEEPELQKTRTPIVLPPTQKHYKIIFVKTPSDTRTPQVIPVPQQHEEKTIVYVLSKKQDEPQDILVPKIENKPPTKPEVYFIKYKNKEDSQSVIDNIVNDYNKGQGQSVSFSGLEDASTDGFGSSSSGSFGSDSHGTIGSYPVFSTGSYGHPSSFSHGHYTEHLSNSPIHIQGPATDFVTETYGINKVSSGPQTYTVGTSDYGYGASLPESSTIFGGLVSGNNIVSTTTSGISPDGNVISTSQGVPHESYGPPKFRTV